MKAVYFLLPCLVVMKVKSKLTWKSSFHESLHGLFRESYFMEAFTFYSTKVFTSVSTAACMKPSVEVTPKEVWMEDLAEAFCHGSYFHGSYFHERSDGN